MGPVPDDVVTAFARDGVVCPALGRVSRLTSRTNSRARGVALSVNTTLRGEFALRDGTPALIWPLLPSDARMLRVGFRQLSPQSRRSRFLSPLDDMDEAMIERLVGGVDGVHHVALVLVVLPSDGLEQPVGVARLIQDPSDPATADIAVTVADQWQGRGVGAALVRALMQRRPPGLRRIRTVVDAGNQASLALLGAAGRMTSSETRRGVVDVTVELPAA